MVATGCGYDRVVEDYCAGSFVEDWEFEVHVYRCHEIPVVGWGFASPVVNDKGYGTPVASCDRDLFMVDLDCDSPAADEYRVDPTILRTDICPQCCQHDSA
ncbi:hypothetical protein BBJ29_003784 [Phytophthora kernoviae]|uniref:Uncharacterized protein n=1 Tax=Phytophthora kernoviae TaxID=325452 RepID=A0A3F2RR46_9STRA|nr:hypothetical protein BBJ29_003784 [Phytophthora kernoviae]RLN61793.1 hypothetical protein BBP00_00005189 [Phytophthora kernoviae]